MRGDHLSDVLGVAMDAGLMNLHTCMPAIIQRYDPKQCLADVQPVFTKTWPDDADDGQMSVEQYPVITNVPVVFPRAQQAIVRLPVTVGDSVLLIFSERSIDAWMNSPSGGVLNQQDTRKFNIQDAIAIPGIYPFAVQPPNDGAATSLVLQNAQSYVEVLASGKFKLFSKASNDEVLSMINDLCTALIQAIPVVSGAPGDFAPSTITAITAVQNRIQAVKG